MTAFGATGHGFPPIPGDDVILPFAVEALDVRGRVAQLGSALDTILSRHDYPVPVARLLGEAIVLTVLLGTAFKLDGRFILQIQSDGPVSLLVADFTSPSQLRGYARFDREAVAALTAAHASPALGDLVGKGHLALTLDPGPTLRRYQGIVALEGTSLEEIAHRYFVQSEQIPTFIRLAVAETLERREGEAPRHIWRGGGISIQFLPASLDRVVQRDLDPGDPPEDAEPRVHEPADDDAWVEARARTETVEDHELIDPAVEPARLLLRLFNERSVRVFDPIGIEDRCHCSRERVAKMLGQFTEEERETMVEDGRIVVTCEFCSTRYTFSPDDV